MRYVTIAFSAIVLASASVYADEPAKGKVSDSPLQGTWRLVAGKYGSATDFENLPASETMFKLVTDTHFIWVRFDTETKEILHAAGGKCATDADKYVESIEYGVGPVMQLKGERQSFAWKVKGNKWHHSGTLSNGQRLEEVFERIKNGTTSSPLQGAWKCVAAKYGDATEFRDLPPSRTQIKIVTDTHYTWVDFDTKTAEVSRAGGGTFTVDGDAYTESFDFGLGRDIQRLKGERQSFTWKVDEDRWYHSGTLSIGLRIEQILERLKK